MRKRIVFKIIAVVLIQAFLNLNYAGALDDTAPRHNDCLPEINTLSPHLAINAEQFKVHFSGLGEQKSPLDEDTQNIDFDNTSQKLKKGSLFSNLLDRYLVYNLVDSVLSAKAPEEIAPGYEPGFINIQDATLADSLVAKVEQVKAHLFIATNNPVVQRRVVQALNILAEYPPARKLKHMQFEKIGHKLVKLITCVENAYKGYKEALDEGVGEIYKIR
ncbi:MAG: hypothetical protein KKH34_06675 [Candidatus Omnitrophica bacterium]|nr:hypothetical protein [Candidatus Omnitrophota bacterium]